MTDPNFILLYVANPIASAEFYSRLLGKPAQEVSPTFAMFGLDTGVMLGLWAAHTVAPAPDHGSARGELAFTVAGVDEVHARFRDWSEAGLMIAQEPTRMDFGTTFVACDPDGHRLRVFAPGSP
ncbi:MAG: VOC family protein [Pseudomonadota bacterium]|nr:VOC family protein [Pseudomonadota bacterium]